jgi:methylated-DNA-[protein]-cysteine S-methyltransferase
MLINDCLQLAVFSSKLGWMAAVGDDEVLLELTFGHPSPQRAVAAVQLEEGLLTPSEWNPSLVRRLQAFAEGEADDFRDVLIDTSDLTPFQRSAVEHCRRIPYGQTRTYGQLAALAGSPGAARAVGNVMAANRTPLVVPCHRVVASAGQIGNYSAAGGRRMKLRLLETEATADERVALVH